MRINTFNFSFGIRPSFRAMKAPSGNGNRDIFQGNTRNLNSKYCIFKNNTDFFALKIHEKSRPCETASYSATKIPPETTESKKC